MPLATVCFTGFSRDDQAKAHQFFAQANADTGNRFELAPEADAKVLVIDMDSMYGHMTWLKAQGSGKTTVGLTSGERCETDFILKSPMSSDALRKLQSGDAAWERMVPPEVAKVIKAREFFGYRPGANGA